MNILSYKHRTANFMVDKFIICRIKFALLIDLKQIAKFATRKAKLNCIKHYIML